MTTRGEAGTEVVMENKGSELSGPFPLSPQGPPASQPAGIQTTIFCELEGWLSAWVQTNLLRPACWIPLHLCWGEGARRLQH